MRIYVVIGLVLTMGLAVAVAPAAAGDVHWIGAAGARWDVGTNWSPEGEPMANDDVFIANNNWCKIPASHAASAQTIDIDTGDEVRMRSGSSLTLGEQDYPHDSVIDGLLTVGSNGAATLKISGSHTITGDDGTIELKNSSIIDDNGDDDDLLTIEGDSEADCSKDDRPLIEDSLVITGVGSIKVALQNEAYVVAGPPGVLVLADHDKDSGCCGSWIAEEGGELGVQCLVEGTGTWRAQDDDYEDDDYLGGTITIGYDGTAGCVLSDGPVYVNGFSAVLGVTATGYFCTDGNLRFQSVLYDEDQKTNPMIWVAPDGGAEFGVCNDVQCPE